MEGARRATADDVGTMVALHGQASDELEAFRGARLLFLREARRQPLAQSFVEALEDPAQSLWVGTIDDVVVGYAAGRVDELDEAERLGRIQDLFVEPPAREVGVGEALADALIGWFEQRGCTGVDAMALPGARATKNFFEESGFTARLLVMHKRLDPA